MKKRITSLEQAIELYGGEPGKKWDGVMVDMPDGSQEMVVVKGPTRTVYKTFQDMLSDEDSLKLADEFIVANCCDSHTETELQALYEQNVTLEGILASKVGRLASSGVHNIKKKPD